MKKNHYLLASLALMGLGSGSIMFTSCQKDYDGELEIIRNQIKNGIVSLEELENKITLINEQLTVLNQAIIDGDAENKAAIEKVASDLEGIKNDLQGKIDALDKRIKANEDNITTIKNDITALDQKFERELLEISNRIDDIDTALNTLDGRVQKLEDQVKALQEKDILIDTAIEEIKKEMEGLGGDMAGQKEKLEIALRELEATKQILHNEIARIEGLMLKLNEINGEQHEVLRKEIADAVVEMKGYVDGKVDDLINQMGSFSVALGELRNGLVYINSKYDLLSDRLTGLTNTFNEQISKIWAEIAKLEGTDDTKVKELQEIVFALNEDLNSLRNELNVQLTDILNKQKLFGQDLDKVESIVEEHTVLLNNYKAQLDALGVTVTRIDQELQYLKKAFYLTITDIENRLEELENTETPETDVTELKQQLEELKQQMAEQADKIGDLTNSQQQQANELANLSSWAEAQFIALDANLRSMNQQVYDNRIAINTLFEKLSEANSAIYDLKWDVASNKSDIIALQKEIESIKNGERGFITADDVEKMLNEYYNKETIDNKFTELLGQINALPTKDDVDKAINDAKTELQKQLDEMNGKIGALEKAYQELSDNVSDLMNRIQSLELIADYNNGMIMVKEPTPGNFQMVLNLETTPEGLVQKIEDFKGIVSLRCRSVTPVRGGNDKAPEFKIENITKGENGSLQIKVNFEGTYKLSNPELPWQVAVALDDKNTSKLSEYRPLRLFTDIKEIDKDAEYSFKCGNDALDVKYSYAAEAFKTDEIKPLNILTTKNDHGNSITEIDTAAPLFEEKVFASSKVPSSPNQNITVKYGIALIFDQNGASHMDLGEYIDVSQLGIISMKKTLDPNITNGSLEGYRIVVGIQAIQDGIKYGKPAYVCFSLEMKQ